MDRNHGCAKAVRLPSTGTIPQSRSGHNGSLQPSFFFSLNFLEGYKLAFQMSCTGTMYCQDPRFVHSTNTKPRNWARRSPTSFFFLQFFFSSFFFFLGSQRGLSRGYAAVAATSWKDEPDSKDSTCRNIPTQQISCHHGFSYRLLLLCQTETTRTAQNHTW